MRVGRWVVVVAFWDQYKRSYLTHRWWSGGTHEMVGGWFVCRLVGWSVDRKWKIVGVFITEEKNTTLINSLPSNKSIISS